MYQPARARRRPDTPGLPPRDGVDSLVALLRWRALTWPDAPLYRWCDDEGGETTRTFAEVDARARAIAGALQALAQPGDRALLLYAPGLEYIEGFLGCLYAGVVAVPAYPPDPMRLARSVPRLLAQAADAGARLALTTATIAAMGAPLFELAPALRELTWVNTDELGDESARGFHERDLGRGDVAFLQYTSGSTGSPRGVVLTHGNLLDDLALIMNAFVVAEGAVSVSWLPPYHDMGLIGGVLGPLYCGGPAVLMSPLSFLQRPRRWLEAISRHQAEISGGPNFAYDLCARKVGPGEHAGLDLSSWAVAFNGAEPVRAETLARFADRFAASGFRRQAFYPCYGLAEATLLVSGPAEGEGPTVRRFEREALARGRVHPLDEAGAGRAGVEDDGGQALVSSGRLRSGQALAVVDPSTGQRAPDDATGEVWLRGPNVASGYWGRPDETAETFGACLPGDDETWLRTGDLGFVHEGELFITGRLKDLIIIRGRNLAPQDIERTVEGVSAALRPGCGAAFGVDERGDAAAGERPGGGEALVVVHELDETRPVEPAALAAQIVRAVGDAHDVTPSEVVLVRRGEVPKTSSGKVQRRACRGEYLAGKLQVIARAGRASSGDAGLMASAPAAGAATRSAPTSAEQLAAFVGEWVAARLGGGPCALDLSAAQHGLDSLGAIELASALEGLVGGRVPVSLVLTSPSLRRLAEDVFARSGRDMGEDPGAAADPNAVALGETEGEGHPLTHGQEGLWYFQQLAPSSAAYVLACAALIEQPLDLAALRRAVLELARQHPMLGARFEHRGERPRQHPGAFEPAFRAHTSAGWSDEALRSRLHEEARRPFDLAREAPFRVDIFSRGPTEHALVLAVHHLAADFWSLGTLVRDLGALYAPGRDLPASDSPAAQTLPAGASFVEHARRQRALLAGPAGAELERYWRSALGPEPPVLDLPTDRPRAPARRFKGASREYELERELASALSGLARAEGTTLFCVLLAATQAVLGRLSGQDMFFVGTPVAGRGSPELAPVVGYFADPVPLRAELQGDPPFRSLVARVRQSLAEALDHQGLPFPLLVERLGPPRDPSRSPIFQVLFVLQRPQQGADPALAAFLLGREGQTLRVGELELRSVALEREGAHFDLTLMAAEAVGGGLALSAQYDTDLFDPATVDRFFGLLESTCRHAVARPDGRISELGALPAAQAELVLDAWNRTRHEYPAGRCVHELFEEQARRSPDAIAVECGERRLTYRELDARASRLARWLCEELGPGPEARIALRVARSERMVVAMLAALKAGLAYVPVDAAAPPARVRHAIEDAGAIALLVDGVEAPPEPVGCPVFSLSRGEEGARSLPDGPLGALASPRGLAYLVFTSGTTGRPRGVMVEHRSAVNFLTHVVRCDAITSADRVLQQASPAFDFSVGEIFPVLFAGGALVIAPEPALRDPQALLACLERERITILNTVPAIVSLLNGLPPVRLPHLRLLFSGGEALSFGEIDRLRGRVAIGNGYGPTETTVASTYCMLDDYEGPEAATVPIGRPVANTRVYVLDGQMRPVPIGATGELYIAGDGVSRGYVGRPAATAEKFVPDPFGPPGGRMYRSGDLARWLPRGVLEFVGRADHQIKLRGFRIEPLEIESVLLRHPGVRECTVLAREDHPGQKRLVAYALGDEARTTTADELARFAAAELPQYMVPAAFVLLPHWPLTTNGKIDRARLPPPDRAPRTAAATPPRSPLEAEMLGFWQQALGAPELGVDDDFFRLGGNSLHAAQLAARVRATYGVDLPLGELMLRPTVATAAQLVARALASASSEDDLGALLDEIEGLSDDEAAQLTGGRPPGDGEPPFGGDGGGAGAAT